MTSSWRSLGSAPPDFWRALPACAPQSCARPAWRFIANCRARTRSARTHVGAGWIRPVRAVTRAMPAVCVSPFWLVITGPPVKRRPVVSVLARFWAGTCPRRFRPSWPWPDTNFLYDRQLSAALKTSLFCLAAEVLNWCVARLASDCAFCFVPVRSHFCFSACR